MKYATHLIAAAPDTLSELVKSNNLMQKAVDFMRSNDIDVHQADLLQLQILSNQAAIAKARGQA